MTIQRLTIMKSHIFLTNKSQWFKNPLIFSSSEWVCDPKQYYIFWDSKGPRIRVSIMMHHIGDSMLQCLTTFVGLHCLLAIIPNAVFTLVYLTLTQWDFPIKLNALGVSSIIQCKSWIFFLTVLLMANTKLWNLVSRPKWHDKKVAAFWWI